ncbi:MAG TPA: radical SAM protein, partial [Microvirga sp.]|nr:radical SAM protein [Microvirga sp.]
WSTRQSGVGPYAWMIGRRFETAAERLGLNKRNLSLRKDLFMAPAKETGQMSLF